MKYISKEKSEKDKWRNIWCKQANDVHSAEINKWIKRAVLAGARTGHQYTTELVCGQPMTY